MPLSNVVQKIEEQIEKFAPVDDGTPALQFYRWDHSLKDNLWWYRGTAIITTDRALFWLRQWGANTAAIELELDKT